MYFEKQRRPVCKMAGKLTREQLTREYEQELEKLAAKIRAKGNEEVDLEADDDVGRNPFTELGELTKQ